MLDNKNRYNINIQLIVEQGKLVEFILGEDEFSFDQSLKDDYTRWKLLREYYQSLDRSLKHKRDIEKTIIYLFNNPNPQAKFASLDLSRLLHIEEIEFSIQQNIETGQFFHMPENLQNELLYVATKLQLNSVKLFVIETLLGKNKLSDFLLWNSTPLHVLHVINKESIWSIESISEFYQKAGETAKHLIVEQINLLYDKYPKVRSILNHYLLKSPSTNEFIEMLREILASQ